MASKTQQHTRPLLVSSPRGQTMAETNEGRTWVLLAFLGIVGAGAVLIMTDVPLRVRRLLKQPTPPAASYLPPEPKVVGPALAEQALPTEPPFVGEPGTDAAGYPLRRVDRIALLQLLRAGKFERLERFITGYQEQFEADYRKEYWPYDALMAFSIADPEVGKALDEWVAAMPASYAALGARGVHRLALALYMRGAGTVKETSNAQFVSMHSHNQAALKDLKRAIHVRPKLLVAHVQRLVLAMFDGANRRELKDLMRKAVQQCPSCVEIRIAYIQSLRPRWGGSHDAMKRYAATLAPLIADNPMLGRVASFVDADICWTHRQKKDFVQAHRACDEALTRGDEPRLLEAKIRLLQDEERYDDVLPLAERALRISPQREHSLKPRMVALEKRNDYLRAAEDLNILRQLDPSDTWVAKRVTWMVQRLRYDGDQLRKRGDRAGAAKHFTLALTLVPHDQDLRARLGWLDANDVVDLRKELGSKPDDFEAHLRLDHALVVHRRFDQIVEMWDEFIRRHPSDARAYRERSGAKFHGGDKTGALADSEKACALGMKLACGEAARMRSELPSRQ